MYKKGCSCAALSFHYRQSYPQTRPHSCSTYFTNHHQQYSTISSLPQHTYQNQPCVFPISRPPSSSHYSLSPSPTPLSTTPAWSRAQSPSPPSLPPTPPFSTPSSPPPSPSPPLSSPPSLPTRLCLRSTRAPPANMGVRSALRVWF